MLRQVRYILCFGLVFFLLLACNDTVKTQPEFFASENPATLSEWNLFTLDKKTLRPNLRVTPYDLNSPLFSDYAHKFRTIWMPDGVSAIYSDTETFAFPVGTIISKIFYYPKLDEQGYVAKTEDHSQNFTDGSLNLAQIQMIETRLLVRRESGWVALPYIWNETQTEARLKRTGEIMPLTLVADNGTKTPFNYIVPNTNQCAGCHVTNNTTRELLPIGPKARHLNRAYFNRPSGVNQLTQWTELGFLTGAPEPEAAPRLADSNDAQASLDKRARAYLDINCSHCHNRQGPAGTSGLHFEPDTEYGAHLGICKRSIAAGSGTGGHSYDIVPGDPDTSILTFRMLSTRPDEMMPELGRDTPHAEGVALMSEWIANMRGGCQ